MIIINGGVVVVLMVIEGHDKIVIVIITIMWISRNIELIMPRKKLFFSG